MRFRTRLFLALALAGVIPLVFLALGVRREVDRRLSAEYRARVDGAVRRIRADLTRESSLPPLMIQPIDFVQLYQQKLGAQTAGRA